MRFTRLLPVLFVPAIACGGGESKPPVPVDTTPPTPDTPTVLECPPTGLMGSVGSNADPIGDTECTGNGGPCDWYDAPTEGTNTGITEFIFVIGVQDTMDQLQFRLATPIVAGTAVPWETDITSQAAYQAFSIYLQSQNGSVVDRILFPQNGSITLTESNQQMGGKTVGSVSATTYAELDDDGAVLAGGCTSDIASLSFNLVQGTADFQKPAAPGATAGKPWMKIVKADKFGTLVPRN